MSVKKKKKISKRHKVGLTFGVFDLCHSGHLTLLMNAKSQCDQLIVYVSDDAYVRKHKGITPLMPFEERKNIIESLKFVNIVGTQSVDFGKKEAVEKHKPDVLFVGDDWNKDTYTGMGLGVPVIFLPYTKTISSTSLRKRIVRLLKSEIEK